MNSSLNMTIVMQSERGAMHTVHMRTGNIQCAFLRVHPRVYAYPAVLLELLSAAGASFATPLWSVLRIEVKEPLSKGKLMGGEAREENGSGAGSRDEDKQMRQSESVWVTNIKKVQSIIDGGAGGNKGTDSLAFTEGLF